jgi:heat shock protein HslJ
MAATMMACDESVMQQATAFLTRLNQVRSYRIAAGQLVLLSADDVLLASLAPQVKGLAGTAWQVTGYNNGRQAVVSALADTTLSMAFSADGKVSGSAGCNNYSAAYTLAGPVLRIGPAATTRKMCGAPPNIMEQEQQFLAALATVASVRQEGGRLELRTASGALAVSLARDTAD